MCSYLFHILIPSDCSCLCIVCVLTDYFDLCLTRVFHTFSAPEEDMLVWLPISESTKSSDVDCL